MSGNREKFCEVCNQSFERPTGLISHNKSKNHVIKTNNFSAPTLTWDVLLLNSQHELDLISDLHMFLIIKNNILCGILSIMGNRKLEAYNYKIIQEYFDIKVDENYIF